MDTLPNEILTKIFKEMHFEDQARLSAVSKRLNLFVRAMFEPVECVQVQLSLIDYSGLPQRSSVLFEETNPLMLNLREDTDISCNKSLDFMANFFPNLTVINAPNVTIKAETLMKFAKRIKYFSLFSISGPESTVENTLTPKNFPNLLAFDIDNTENERFLLHIRDKLGKANPQFMQQFYPWIKDVHKLSSNVKSLRLAHWSIIGATLPENVANSLQVLYISGVQLGTEPKLPNLRLLKVKGSRLNLLRFILSISDSDNLSVLALSGDFNKSAIDKLSELFLKWNKMQFVSLDGTGTLDSSIRIPIGPELCYFSVTLNTPITFVTINPLKLKHFHLVTSQIEVLPGNGDFRQLMSALGPLNALQTLSLIFLTDPRPISEEEKLILSRNRLPVGGLTFFRLRKKRLELCYNWTKRPNDEAANFIFPETICGNILKFQCDLNDYTCKWSLQETNHSNNLSFRRKVEGLLELFKTEYSQ